MSLLVNAYLEYLDATLVTGPLETEYKLLVGWLRKPASEGFGSDNRALTLRDSANALSLEICADGTPKFFFDSRNGGSGSSELSSAVTNDTWTHVALLLPPNTSAAQPRNYINGTGTSTAAVAGDVDEGREMDRLRIGAGMTDSSGRWRGYIAEVAVFKPTSVANANAIVTELQTKTPDNCTNGTPLWYASLESDATVTIGASLTTSGSPTYDAGVHPTVTGPAAGATITLTDPVAVVTGSTASCTITRSTAASGNITYNLTSSATGVATVPATATILDGQTTGSFNITGVSAGSSTITATNAADSGETDTATANVSALKGLTVTFGQTNLSGLTFAWFDQASPDLFAAPTVVGTTESTDGSGVLEIDLTGTSVAVGNTGFLLIYKTGATAPDDLAFFGRLTVQDIG